MHPRQSTLIAVAAVLGTVGIIAACTGSNDGDRVATAGAAGAPTVVATVAPPSTLELVAVDTPSTPATPPSDSSGPLEVTPPVDPPAAGSSDTLPQIAPTTAAPTTTVDPYLGYTRVAPPSVPITAVGESDGPATSALQQRLLDLGFWLSATDGTYGTTTRQAVMAFQKYNLVEATGEVDERTAQLINEMPIRAVASAREGDLVEIDKVTQLLFVVRGGVTVWVFNASTGNGLPYEEEDQNSPGEIARGVSLTPDGEWKVNRERAEGWWEGDLGQIYRPKYFRYGIAVHGSGSVPNYPASHGCVRVSVQAMDYIWATDLMPMRSKVWVHGG